MKQSEIINELASKLESDFEKDPNVSVNVNKNSVYFNEQVLDIDKHRKISEKTRITELIFTDVFSYVNEGKTYFLHKYQDEENTFTNLGHGLLIYYACNEPTLGLIVKTVISSCPETDLFIQRKPLNPFKKLKKLNPENRLIPGDVVRYRI